MPKRKHNKDYEYISDQIKKLKKKLKRVRKQDESSSASDTDSKHSYTEQELLEDLITEPEICDDTQQAEIIPVITNTQIASDSVNNLDQTTSEVANAESDDHGLDKDLLEILGEDPSSEVQYGQEIHKELASRLQHITTTGLTKETRKELQQKYLLPANGVLLGAPTMNPEIKAALPETLANRDKALETKQKLLASAISCVATGTTQLLSSQDKNNELLRKLMDTNRILCDIQHSDSVTRRMFSTSVLKKDVKSQILNSKIDKFLFGENLPDALKTAKAVSKSSAEIKNTANRNNKKPQPSTSKASNLNSKAPAASTRRPPATTQKTRQPIHQSQHAKSSRTSSQSQKTSNRRR